MAFAAAPANNSNFGNIGKKGGRGLDPAGLKLAIAVDELDQLDLRILLEELVRAGVARARQ